MSEQDEVDKLLANAKGTAERFKSRGEMIDLGLQIINLARSPEPPSADVEAALGCNAVLAGYLLIKDAFGGDMESWRKVADFIIEDITNPPHEATRVRDLVRALMQEGKRRTGP